MSMRPAPSIVFFTATSGAGLGVFAVAPLLAALGVEPVPGERAALGAGALAAVIAGLLSSTLHLANPRNAWRSILRVRTSWLSREAVLAIAFLPAALAWIGLDEPARPAWLDLACAALALATVWSTGMIYGCLRTVPAWHTLLTPVNFVLASLALGALAATSARAATGAALATPATAAGALLALSFVGKLVWAAAARAARGPSLGRATGLERAAERGPATVRLLDVGHSGPTFLTEEFGYVAPQATLTLMRVVAFALGAAVPMLLVSHAATGGAPASAHAALGLAWAGLLAERWLFFAESRHVVATYHGLPGPAAGRQ